jgi:hypothetical protein
MNRANHNKDMPPYPYNLIEEWWGEPLTAELRARIRAAPEAQVWDFMEDSMHTPDSFRASLPELPDGTLRPLLREDWLFGDFDRRTGEPFSRLLLIGLNVLLYSQQIAMESPIHPNLDITGMLQVIDFLLDLKPLVDARVIYMGHVTSRTHHPSALRPTSIATIEAAVPEIKQTFGCDDGTANTLVRDVMGLIEFTRGIGGRVNPMARSSIEYEVMAILMREAWRDRKFFDLTALASLAVPRIQGAVKELVAIRQSDEAFALWRQSLASAITQLNRIPVDDENWQEDANGIIYAELEPMRSKISRTVAKSPLLSSLQTGTSRMLLAGVGAVGGWTLGGGIPSALSTSAITLGLDGIAAYLRAVKERSVNQAILDLALLFRPDQAVEHVG